MKYVNLVKEYMLFIHSFVDSTIHSHQMNLTQV